MKINHIAHESNYYLAPHSFNMCAPGHVKAVHALQTNRETNKSLFVPTYLFKMLNVKHLAVMNNERLINLAVWRRWPGAI